MPATTPVYSTLGPCRRTRITSPLGPLTSLRTPRTSTSMGSGLVPSNTVYATPRMPAWIWLKGRILVFRDRSLATPATVNRNRLNTTRGAKFLFFIQLLCLDRLHMLKSGASFLNVGEVGRRDIYPNRVRVHLY